MRPDRPHLPLFVAWLLAILLSPLCISLPIQADPVIRDFQPVRFFKNKKTDDLDEKAGEWIYEALDNPHAVQNKLARGAAYGALDLVGVARPVKALIEELGDATEFEFGECTEMKLRGSLAAETCLDGGASLELDADYDLQGLQLKYHWHF